MERGTLVAPEFPMVLQGRPVRLLDQVREAMWLRRYSPRTVCSYVAWIRRFVVASGMRHPRELGREEVTAFLSSLATIGKVSASTQNQALAALLFLYHEVLGIHLEWLKGLVRAKRPARRPVVLDRGEVRAVLSAMRGAAWLMASLIYGSGLRLSECVSLRVKDIDPVRCEILLRDGKGRNDRVI